MTTLNLLYIILALPIFIYTIIDYIIYNKVNTEIYKLKNQIRDKKIYERPYKHFSNTFNIKYYRNKINSLSERRKALKNPERVASMEYLFDFLHKAEEIIANQRKIEKHHEISKLRLLARLRFEEMSISFINDTDYAVNYNSSIETVTQLSGFYYSWVRSMERADHFKFIYPSLAISFLSNTIDGNVCEYSVLERRNYENLNIKKYKSFDSALEDLAGRIETLSITS